MKTKWLTLVICFVLVYLIALLGGLFTDTTGWYESVKPAITPPNIVFPIVWNILFFLIALSLYLSWVNKKSKRVLVGTLFGTNLVLNFLWSFIFFGLKKPVLAFVDLILIWISIFVLIVFTSEIDRKAALMLVPYFLWVSFAGVLNYLVAF